MIPNEIVNRRDLTGGAKVVWGVLRDRQGQSGWAWPSLRRLGQDAGMSSTTVVKAIRQLEARSLIVVNRFGQGSGRSNKYQIVTVVKMPKEVTRNCSSNVPETGQGVTRNCSSGVSETGQVVTRNCYVTIPIEPDPLNQRKKRGAKKAAMEFPHSLDTQKFRATWTEWVTHRREIKKTLTPATTKAQIKQLEKFGHDKAIESIERSITNGWIGLFEPPSEGKQPGNQTARRRTAARASEDRGEYPEPNRPIPRL